MGKREKPPRWQEGSHEFEVPIPKEKTGSGEEQTVGIRINWKVSPARPMNARERTRWETELARQELEIACTSPDDNAEMTVRQAEGLERALTHACRAWCRTHLRGKDASQDNEAVYSAFFEKAPEDLRQAVVEAAARMAGHAAAAQLVTKAETVAAVQDAVDALLEAVANPPRNRRRFPARLRGGRPPRTPRVRPGSVIDTGRYRPAVVLETTPDPPHIMKLSYGDEIDERFLPHITHWKSVRKKKRLPSLKDVFSPGDWIRHPYSGYGRVVAVRNSTMDVDYRGCVGTVTPPADLARFEKVDDPGPEDTSPVEKRFPPGTWIETDPFGTGVVLAVEDGLLAVLFRYEVMHISAPAEPRAPVIWKLDREPLDLRTPWGRRWAWWLQHTDICSAPACPCCGYPNLGRDKRSCFEPRECIICGFPDFGTGVENDDEPVVFHDGTHWLDMDDWFYGELDEPEFPHAGPTRQECAISGYSLGEARRNYENSGAMFRPGDGAASAFGKSAELRRSLVGLLEETMAEPARWGAGNGQSVERVRQDILSALEDAPPAPMERKRP